MLAWPAGAHGSRCRGIPSVSVTSENGAEYIGHISLGQGSGASAHPCGGGYYVTSSVILADMPMGGGAPRLCGRNAYRSGVSVRPLLPEPERGQPWVG